MKTAKEICKDSIKQLGYGTDETFVQSIIDESVAHGMTISAEICNKNAATVSPLGLARKIILDDSASILTARDHKVWRRSA